MRLARPKLSATNKYSDGLGCINDREWHKQAHDGIQRGTDHKRLINRCFSSANQKVYPKRSAISAYLKMEDCVIWPINKKV